MNASLPKLTCDHFGIKANRLLLPIDLARCPLEILPLAGGFTKPLYREIVLLHVLDRRRNGPGRLMGENDLRQAERHLQRIGRENLPSTVEASFRVRTGIPHEEILAETHATGVDLILLPTFAPSIWRRWAGFSGGETVRNVVAGARCRVFVVTVRHRFNCFRRWAGEEVGSPCTP